MNHAVLLTATANVNTVSTMSATKAWHCMYYMIHVYNVNHGTCDYD